MIRNIIFDIGNVLVGYNWREYMDGFGFPAEKEQAVAAALFGSDTWTELDRGRIPLRMCFGFSTAPTAAFTNVTTRFRGFRRCMSRVCALIIFPTTRSI